MKYLLDTHIFLWSLLEPGKLTNEVQDILTDMANELWLSPITTWETIILVEKKKIELASLNVVDWINEVFSKVPFKEAALNHEVAMQSRQLNLNHQDPADRFIAASALVYDLTLITSDKRLLELANIKLQPN
jgi:PIN domain nuclease of toxin-antitoxin system